MPVSYQVSVKVTGVPAVELDHKRKAGMYQ